MGQGIPPLYSRPAMSFETLRKTQNAKMDVHSSIISSAYHRPTLVGQAEVGLGRARRPGPAQKIFRGWATARPGPANFRGFAAAQPSPSHFQNFTARPGPSFFPKSRPGPAHFMAAKPMRHGLYMGWPDNYVGRPVDLTGRPMGRPVCCPVLKGTSAYADVNFLR